MRTYNDLNRQREGVINMLFQKKQFTHTKQQQKHDLANLNTLVAFQYA